MVWPFARSKGGSSSSVAALIAVETNALISALRAVVVAASVAMMIAAMRMTIPAADPAPRRMVSHARASVRRLGASLQPAAVGRQSPLRLRSIRDMASRLPRSNALKLPAMLGHGEWNESRTQEDREEDRQEQEAGEESGAEKGGGKESRASARGPREKSDQQRRRADHLEFQAHRPSLARRFRRHGRRHVDPDRARRPPHPLARARERAKE